MIGNVSDLPAGSAVEADVCVVGAGPTGLALAREFAATNALRVVVLESGGLGIEPAAQRLNEGVRTLGLPHKGHTSAGRARTFGGTGRLWAGQCLPLDPIDFEERPWVPFSGWPVSAASLAPYLARAEAFFRIEGEAYDGRNYARFGLEAPRWSPDALRSMFTVYTPRIDTGADRLREFRRSASVRVLLHAVAACVETDAAGARAEGVSVLAPDRTVRRVRAPTVVLCAGGLENARLLLLSDGARPAGLGNDRGLVGRFFQEHPTGTTATLEPADPGDLQDRFRLLYGKGGRRYFPKFALGEATQRRERVLNCNAHLVFDYPDDSVQHALRDFVLAARRGRLPDMPLRRTARSAAGAGEVGRALARRWLRGLSPSGRPTAVRLQCHLEQAPSPESRVLLSRRERDVLGLPAMEIDWRVTDLERRTLQVMTEAARREFDRLGLGRLQPAEWLHDAGADWRSRIEDCYHHIGTTRMAASPETGVVGPDCGVFGVGGLFVAGGSVFPTSGYANPTLTMVALAIRLADRIKARRTEGEPRSVPLPARRPGEAFAGALGTSPPEGRGGALIHPLGASGLP